MVFFFFSFFLFDLGVFGGISYVLARGIRYLIRQPWLDGLVPRYLGTLGGEWKECRFDGSMDGIYMT